MNNITINQKTDLPDHSKIVNQNKNKAIKIIENFFKKINPIRFLDKEISKNLFKTVRKKNLEANVSLKKILIGEGLIANFKTSSSKRDEEKSIVLDGIIIKPSLDENKKSDKYILIFNGMNDCYDNHIPGLRKLAEDTGANIVTFDYRGIEASKGVIKSKKSVLKDSQLILNYLTTEQKIKKENIAFFGHSLGGGIAAEFHESITHSGALISESSFGSFSEAVAAKGGLLLKLASLIVKFSSWNLNGHKAFKKAEKKGIIFNKKDRIVHYKASLYKSLKKENRTETKDSYTVIKVNQQSNPHS